MLVLKFGGTSVGSAQRFEGVLDVVRSEASKEASKNAYKGASKQTKGSVVVLSAMSGVTNRLIEAAECAFKRDLTSALLHLEELKERHYETAQALIPDMAARIEVETEIALQFSELEIVIKGISYLGELTKRSLDAVSGMGELLSSRIFAAYAQFQGENAVWLDARRFIITDESFGKANPLWEEINSRVHQIVLPQIQTGKTVITQGFIGASLNGASTTLGRGGSDYSASIIGAAFDASEIQIWTDVDGMLTADPRVVPDARVLSEVSFQEASELAYFGAKLLHPLTVRPAVEKEIPVRILNSMRPDGVGTMIKNSAPRSEVICAIAAKKKIKGIFIRSPKMLMAFGFLAKVFEVFDRFQTPIDLIATSEVSVSITIDKTDDISQLTTALSEFGDVEVFDDLAIVTVVGSQFREQRGIAAQVFTCMADINIMMISGGASDINLSFVVAGGEADKAVCQLHKQFFESKALV